jgi:predicted transcriptional regulator
LPPIAGIELVYYGACCYGVRNRSREEIIAEILWILTEPRGKTAIMHKCMLSYAQVQSYLNIMRERGLALEKSGKWFISENGKMYLRSYRVLCELLDHRTAEFCKNEIML